MNKLIWRTVTITIVETWMITWADGAEQTLVYQATQSCHVLSADPNEPRDWTEQRTVEADSKLCAPVTQTGSSETSDTTS